MTSYYGNFKIFEYFMNTTHAQKKRSVRPPFDNVYRFLQLKHHLPYTFYYISMFIVDFFEKLFYLPIEHPLYSHNLYTEFVRLF